MFIFNTVGFVMLTVCLAVAYGVSALLGLFSNGPILMIAGPLLIITDAAYRMKRATNPHWFYPRSGGSLFFLPMWLWGAIFAAVGVFTVLKGT